MSETHQHKPTETTDQLISPKQFAQHVSLAYSTVMDAIYAGRLKDSVIKTKNGRYQLDLEKAEAEWCAHTDISKSFNAKASNTATVSSQDAHHSYHNARAVKENYLARLAKLDYEERSGSLVPFEGACGVFAEATRMFRDGILAIPDRIAHELAAEVDAHALHSSLSEHLRDVLCDFAEPDALDRWRRKIADSGANSKSTPCLDDDEADNDDENYE